MPRPITREGIEQRRAIRAELDANPAKSHADVRRKFGVLQPMIDSALGKTVAEWTALLDTAPAKIPRKEKKPERKPSAPPAEKNTIPLVINSGSPRVMDQMPGLEQGIVKFTRKPAKMGEDFIFWIPRVYVRNGLVDPNVEYEVYIKKHT